MKNTASIYIVLVILVLVTIYFARQNISYWNFRFQHNEVTGQVTNVENLETGEYRIEYRFFSSEMNKERVRTIKSEKRLSVGDSLIVMYNANYPNYVEIKEFESPINFYGTLISVGVPILCIFLILMGLFGIIDLDKLS